MKKVRLYILFGFLCFLSFFGGKNVFALTSSKTMTILPGNTIEFMSATDYSGINCSGIENLKVFDISKNEYGSYLVKFKDDVSITESGSEQLTCSYENSYAYTDSGSKSTLNIAGSVTYTFKYELLEDGYKLTYHLFKKAPANSVNFAQKQYFANFSEVVSDAVVSSGAEYIDVNCKAGSTDTCIFSLKDGFVSDKVEQATATVVMKNSSGRQITVDIVLFLNPKTIITANAGDYGTCSFGSGWQAINGHYEYEYSSGNIVLPSCTPSQENSLLEFYGWVYPQQLGGNVMNTSICKTFPSVSADVPFDLNSMNTSSFFACYSYKSGIVLDLTNVEVDIKSNWIAQGGNKYFVPFDGQFALPDAKLKNGTAGTKFVGWRLNGTNNSIAVGTPVSSGGTYSPIIEKTQTVVYDYRHIYVGKTEALSYQGKTISSCSSASTANLTTNLVGTECQIHGVKETETGKYTEVFMVVDGETITIKYKVLATPEGDSEENPNEFIINFDYGIDGNYSNNKPSTGGSTNNDDKVNSDVSINSSGMCNTYDVSIGNETDSEVLDAGGIGRIGKSLPNDSEVTDYINKSGITLKNKWNISDYPNGIIGTRHYEAKSRCDNKHYVAFCLQSYLPAPNTISNSTLYKVDNNVTGAASLNKAIQYAYDTYLKNETAAYNTLTENRIGTMIALRLIYILEGGYKDNGSELTLTVNEYLSFIQYYVLAQKVKADHEKGYDVWTWSNSGAKTVAKAIMDEYFGGFEDVKKFEKTEFEVVNLAKEKIATKGDNITLKITGTLKLPEDAYDTEAKIKKISASVKTHNSLSHSDNVTLTHNKANKTTDFSFELTYNIKNAKLLKEKKNIVLDVKFETSTTAFSAAILRAKGSSNHQLMLIYDPNADAGASVNIYFQGDDTTCNLSNYNKPASQFSDEDVTNFKEENCCDLITDVGSELYQTFCQNSCTKTDFSLVCEIPTNAEATGTNDKASNYNIYSMYEAVDYNFKEKYKTCIVDVSKDDNARSNTDQLTDARGNEISLDAYSGNNYCRVSCKEDWNFATSSFKNFTGVNAVKAGSYFQIDNDLFIGGARTCVTTYIDYDKYRQDIWNLSDGMTKNWNNYAWTSTLYNVLVASGKEDTPNFYQYSVDSSKGNKYTCSVSVDEDEESVLSGVSGITCADGTCVTSGLLDDCDEETVKGQYDYGDDIEGLDWGTDETYSYYEKKAATCYVYSVENSAERVAGDAQVRKHEVYATGEDTPTIGSLATTIAASNKTKYSAGADKEAGWYTATGAPTDGSCGYTTKVTDDSLSLLYKQLAGETKYNNKTISTLISEYTDKVVNARKSIDDNADYMSACQNFYLENVSTSNTNTFNSKTDKTKSNTYLDKDKAYGTGYSYKIDESKQGRIESKAAKYRVIETKFEPNIKYQYEEAEYMTLIGNNNYLISNDEKNNEVMGISSDSRDASEKANECVEVSYLKDNYGNTMQLCKNKINTYSYQYSLNDGKDIYTSDSGVAYTNSNSGNIGNNVTVKNIEICQIDASQGYSYSATDNTSKTTCAKAELYYYEVNYVKQTLKNSSFYKNWGNWYVNNVTDVKVHAKDLAAAAKSDTTIKSTANSTGYWSPMARYNVFPIKITTRRNMYRYLYSFDNIGYFNKAITYNNPTTNKTETRDLGRIMGTDVSIILNHNHTCFYEVYEHICKCCGDPILTTAIEPYDVIADDVTEEYCKNNPNGCADSKEDGGSGNGTFGFYSSTVSLYDLDAITDSDASKNLADNWNKDEKFYLEGKTYTTSKGYGLAKKIQERGESIYDGTPEYSYYLDPSALAEIRDYNDSYGYKVTTSTLRSVDSQAMSSETTNFKVEDVDTTVTVGHYASKFLEGQMDSYITEGYRGKLLTNKSRVCQVVVEDASDALLTKAAEDAYQMVQSGDCRWVDYVQKYDDKYIRLAFK